MKLFKVTDKFVTVPSGLVLLSADQAKSRRHNLKATTDPGKHKGDDGVERTLFEVVNPLTFKLGETFGWDGDFPKISQSAVETVEEAAQPAPVTPPAASAATGPATDKAAKPAKGKPGGGRRGKASR